jgi:hypothetical protein
MVGEGDLLDTASSKILVAVVFVVAAPFSVAAVKLSTVYAVVEEAYVEKAYLVDGFIPKKITSARDILGLHGGEACYCRFTPPPQTLTAGQAALAPFTREWRILSNHSNAEAGQGLHERPRSEHIPPGDSTVLPSRGLDLQS